MISISILCEFYIFCLFISNIRYPVKIDFKLFKNIDKIFFIELQNAKFPLVLMKSSQFIHLVINYQLMVILFVMTIQGDGYNLVH